MIGKQELDRLLSLSDSPYATAAPWAIHSEYEVGMPPTIMQAKPLDKGFIDQIEPLNNVDKQLVVEARNALPKLIVEILRLQQKLYLQEQKHIKDIKEIQKYAGLTDLDIQVALDDMP